MQAVRAADAGAIAAQQKGDCISPRSWARLVNGITAHARKRLVLKRGPAIIKWLERGPSFSDGPFVLYGDDRVQWSMGRYLPRRATN